MTIATRRTLSFTCRVRKYSDEEKVKRVLWAIRLNGNPMTGCRPKYCQLCRAWHIVKGTP